MAKLMVGFLCAMLLCTSMIPLSAQANGGGPPGGLGETTAKLLLAINSLEQSGDIQSTFAGNLRYRIQIIDVLLGQGADQQAVAYLDDFLNQIRDPSVLQQQLISAAAASALERIIAGEDETNPTGPSVTVVSGGQAMAAIILPSNATTLESQSATELKDYIKQISGVELPVTASVYGPSTVKIYVGGAPASMLDPIRAGGDDPASFRIVATPDSIYLTGLSDQGTAYAAYELLEQLGVRWFAPGPYGTVVPSASTVSILIQDTIQHPGFSTRRLQGIPGYPTGGAPSVFNATEAAQWGIYNRLGGDNYGSHGFPCTIKNTVRPDLFMVENGKVTGQFDVSKPEVLTCVVNGALAKLQQTPNLEYVSMGPNDGGGEGDSPWDAGDYDPFQGEISTTDRYVRFYNLVIAELERAGYPNVGVATYAYSRYTRPPVREIPNPKILPILAPITVERIHSLDNPLSWERQYLKQIVDGWYALGVPLMYRGYLYNLADPGMPFPMIKQVASEFKYYHDKGVERMRVETLPAWGYHGPALYLATKMMWNPDLNVELTLNDYFTKYYGPAAIPMRTHFNLLEDAYANADYFAGGMYDFSHILTVERLQLMETALLQAETAAAQSGDAAYAARVHTTRIAFDYGKTFMGMIASFNRFDFVEAKRLYDQVNTLSLSALSNKPIALAPTAWSYIERFFGKMMKQGYERVTNGNQIVATLPDEWRAMLDPLGGGAQMGLWKPTLGDESWMKLKTSSQTWSDQGLRYYKGDVWYRTKVDVPASFSGKQVKLWLSSIDESARVWLNGTELTNTAKGKALGSPWEFNATPAVRFGETNVLVIDVTNKILDELGTGGIMGPVVLWSPGL